MQLVHQQLLRAVTKKITLENSTRSEIPNRSKSSKSLVLHQILVVVRFKTSAPRAVAVKTDAIVLQVAKVLAASRKVVRVCQFSYRPFVCETI